MGGGRGFGGAILNVRQTLAYRHVLFPMFLIDKDHNCSDARKHRLPIKGLRLSQVWRSCGFARLRSELKCQPRADGGTEMKA